MITVSWRGDCQGSHGQTYILNIFKVGRCGKALKERLRKSIYLLCLMAYKDPVAMSFDLALRQRKTFEQPVHSSQNVHFANKLFPSWLKYELTAQSRVKNPEMTVVKRKQNQVSANPYQGHRASDLHSAEQQRVEWEELVCQPHNLISTSLADTRKTF